MQKKLEAALRRLKVPLKVNLVPRRLYDYKCTYPMSYDYVTLHNAAFPGKVESLDYYMRTCCLDPSLQNIKSWHFSCGESLVIQGLPLDRNGWHAGDGAGAGNRRSIGIEITRDTLKPDPQGLYFKGEDLALRLTAALLFIKGYGTDRVTWHQTWMPQKACPHRILLHGRKQEVIKRIGAYLRELQGAQEVKPEEPERPAVRPPGKGGYIWRVQTGAFTLKANAEAQMKKLEQAGFPAFLVKEKRK